MCRRVGVVCAAVLVATVGCVTDSFLGMHTDAGGPRQVVPGSSSLISTRLQQGLCDLGIAVLEKRQEGNVALVGKTRSGKMFSLRLKQEKADGGPRTAVTIVWPEAADEDFWPTIVQILTAPPQPDSPNSGTDRTPR